jgi:uncharacterized protein
VHLKNERIYEIREPVHTSVPMDKYERCIIDHPFVQRLRGIRQLGFSHYSFPGATHTRFIHSIGVMHLAGLAFDSIFRDDPFSYKRAKQLRYCLRMAALLHDVGHGPYSHAAEFAMPLVSKLLDSTMDNRRASHEDYTVAIILHSTLKEAIDSTFDFTSRHVAALIDANIIIDDDFFIEKGFDLRGILSQLISSNLDVDRLDYLIRDSYFTGARYGQVDISWLLTHLSRHVSEEGKVSLALDRQALYAVDDFLISRYHMFLMVYFHRKSVAFELMFREYMKDEQCAYHISPDLNEYLYINDSHLLNHMTSDNHPFAKAIVEQKPYKVAFERHGSPREVDLHGRQMALVEAGIQVIPDTSVGVIFSKPKLGQSPIFLLRSSMEAERDMPLHALSSAFAKSRFEACISRLYVPRSQLERANEIMDKMTENPKQQTLSF